MTILDPATGTATFLVEVIEVIYRHLRAKWDSPERKQLPGLSTFILHPSSFADYWNDYVPRHLLPRLHGYELMMAPYANAHMKIGLKLHETGYRFGSVERVRVYLTNALEPPDDERGQLAFAGWTPALAHEAQAVNAIKRGQRFTVVIGNPPYSGHSANKGEWIGSLLRPYYQVDGAPLGERNPKWLQDDYVKFIRLGQHTVEQAGVGVLSFITNHGYLDNPTFRGMRQQLCNAFSKIDILDLHGNAKKKETAADGTKDENVFDIQQGVAICRMVKHLSRSVPVNVQHAGLFGLRKAKYVTLLAKDAFHVQYERVFPQPPFYMFFPRQLNLLAEYEQGWRLTDVFPTNSVGIVTGQDEETIAFTIKNAQGLAEQHRLSEETIKRVLYRPLDIRFIVYDKSVVTRARLEVMCHMFAGPNFGIIFMRQVALNDAYSHFGVSDTLVDNRAFYSNKGIMSFAPLYIYDDVKPLGSALFLDFRVSRKANIARSFADDIALRLELRFLPDGSGDWVSGFGPEDIFHYIYAIFHSHTYRARYAEFLKIDFPRVPLTSSLELFRSLAALGGELVGLHLLESPALARRIT
ncbi:MAG: type ISP restriction/modification enzyme, partial [Ilumatobacteraceae bacterium]